MVGPRTLAFADYRGNKQFISIGNPADNPKIHLFLIALGLGPSADGAHVERAIVIEDSRSR